MSTWNGIGTKFLGFTPRLHDGSHYATKWFVYVHMPIIPLRRYRLTIGESSYARRSNGSVETTQYGLHAISRPKVLEVLATYLAWWIVGPALIALPYLSFTLFPHHGVWVGILLIAGIIWLGVGPALLITKSRHLRGLP